MSWSDAQLVRRLKSGDRAAFETVIERHYQGVFRQMWHFCHDEEIAADLTQDTFEQAWKSLDGFAGNSNVRTWIYTIAVRVWYRWKAANPSVNVPIEPWADVLPDCSLNPAQRLEQSARDAALQRALGQLPAPMRETLVLFYLQDLKYREISQALDVSIGTVKSRIHNGLKQLKALLEQAEAAETEILERLFMRTQLESRLSKLKAPAAPLDLKARCGQTIPATARFAPAKARGLRVWDAPKLGLATLVLATAIGLAFWNARPVANNTAPANGNVAFAQTVEAMKSVSHVHFEMHINMSGESMSAIERKDWRTSKLDVWHGEFDHSQGAYIEMGNHLIFSRNQNLPIGASGLRRILVLPDGTLYLRPANSIDLIVKTNPEEWKDVRDLVVGMMESRKSMWSNFSFLDTDREPELIFSGPATHQGKAANIYIFRAHWSTKSRPATRKGIAAVKTKIFTDSKTHLILSRQTYVIFKDGSERLKGMVDFNYSSPNKAVFDPARLKVGAQIIDQRQHK